MFLVKEINKKIFFLIAVLLIVLFLQGCSGGGGDDATVDAVTLTDSESVAADAQSLDSSDIQFTGSDTANAVTGNFTLTTSGENGSSISWTSDQPDYVSIAPDGTVTITQPNAATGDITVILTATITKGEEMETKEITIIIKAREESDDDVVPTVTFQNIRDNGVVESGFLIGTATAETGLASVEVSLDNGAYATATGTTSWSYKLPTGSSTWLDYSKHTISVRSKDSEGNYLAVSTITVRKGNNKDINGDGYADVVVGAYYYNSGTGRVYVFLSNGSSGVSSTNASSASTIITGESDSRFGYSVSTGDINSDGFADVVAGASIYSSNAGRAYVFHSQGSSGITITSASSASTIIKGQATSYFGCSVSTGDMNGDGYADVLVGAYYYSSQTGRVYVFHSSGSSGVTVSAATSASSFMTGESGSSFGSSVSTGDINGDGYADLIVGAYLYNSEIGRVYVFHSQGSSGIPTTAADSATTIITGESGSRFGYSVSTGDVNGDGYMDLAIGAYYYNSQAGRAYLFYSAGSAGISSTDASFASNIIAGESNSNFGISVSTGDVNGDGYADVLAGSSAYSSNTGRAYVFHSSGSGGVTITNASSASSILTGESNSNFGLSVSTGDVNGDGYSDLLAGSSAYSSNTGRAYLFYSAGSAGVSSTDAVSASSILTGEASSFFGYSVY